ncbi:hypothetical protein J4558_00105 [Leptolyngbya sp. 15MV]|nr:hypothetical protein J4558_00105 [Leptolyngbya sp. 15MV]
MLTAILILVIATYALALALVPALLLFGRRLTPDEREARRRAIEDARWHAVVRRHARH